MTAALENQPARWETQWVTQATVRDGAVALITHVNATMLQGTVDALEFSLPAGLNEARVSGSEVRETVVTGGGAERRTYRVLFQNPLYAGIEAGFTISLELPLGANNRTTLPDLALPGGSGRKAGGFLLVENASSGEMTLDPQGLEPAIEKDVPFLPPLIVAGTRFFRAAPGGTWSLGLRVTSLEKTAGRAALVAYAELTSTLRANGEEWHRATYRLQNRRLQFLPVELPAGTELVGARVAGESVRVDAGAVEKNAAPLLLVPLVKTRPGETSYDVELIYRRPAPGPTGGRPAPIFGHWRLQDPRVPGVPIEKTLWDVYLPTDSRLLNTDGNLEPVVAALSTTEKLESALSDLRDLSATYRSAGASDAERQRALSNYNSLASLVTRQAQAKTADRPVAENAGTQGAFLKKPNAISQNEIVSRKQQLILSTVDSLSAANVTVDQNRQTLFTPQRTVSGAGQARNGFSTNNSDFIDQAASFTGSVGTPTWRDNRAPNPQSQTRINDSNLRTPAADSNLGRDIALNDSVTVNLPSKDAQSFVSARRFESKEAETEEPGVFGTQFRTLSTARATEVARRPTTPSATPRPVLPASPDASALADAPPAGPVTSTAPPAEPAARTETLHSEGRISLAVDFPLEGQVYHFSKIKADARLTLWSVQPSRLDRLFWLGVLLGGLAVVRLLRRMAPWLRKRRVSTVQHPLDPRNAETHSPTPPAPAV